SFLSVRVALDEIPPLTSVLHRVGWAAFALWIYVAIRRLPVPRSPRVWLAFLVMGILNNVIPFGLMAWGQLHIETGLTSILNAATAVFGVLVAALLLSDEHLTLRKSIGVGLGFIGVVTAIGFGNLLHLDLRSLAQWAVLLGTLSYAFAGVWGRVTLAELRPEVAAAGMLTGATVVMMPLVLIVDGPPSLTLDGRTWIAIGYYALIATALAYILFYQALALAGSGNTMIVTLLVAPVAIVLGTFALNESLPANAFVGFGILALGLLILNRTLFPRAAW
ncbi:MAG: DMT family transporter, partial [Pseudomonadota bacterium]